MSKEIWMVWKYGYEVSTHGNVRNSNTGKIKKPSKSGNGYMIFGAFEKCSRKNILVHRAVVEAFLGEIKNGFEVNHKDGNKCNNDISNLEIVTRSENSKHALRMGLRKMPAKRAKGDLHWTRIHPEKVAKGDNNGARIHPEKILKGENCPSSKLSNENVSYIRRLHCTGISQKDLAERFGVSRNNINHIINRKSWKHI